MNEYKYYQEISSKVYKRADFKLQYLVMAFILFAIGILFLIKWPGIEGYAVTGITTAFGLGFINRMFNSLHIDMNSKILIQKPSLLSGKQTIAFSDIQNLSINNSIYVLVLISSALVLTEKKGKPKYILLGQSLMNSKHMEQLLLETEKLMELR
ncbi:hypothetical protein N0B40_05730 [Chryseobacterium oranimense]|uniref:hypothetical protein n=1 Tax=Chryseobacterium oranimense TaxID=421058 RepID=UPI0021B07BE0|nr:hypothetical protein [Chryseobacterium oranimense]UWX61779.1 hypothetical protein N0B40_05730 [Chryseobacterium oranimense]